MSAPVTVCILPPPGPNAARGVSHPGYVREILDHAGVYYETVDPGDLAARLPDVRLLVTVGDTDLPDEARTALNGWVRGGGAWVAVGGAGGLPEVFGVTLEEPAYSTFGGGRCALGEGYLRLDHPLHPVLDGLHGPLHFFGGTACRSAAGTCIAGVLDRHHRDAHRAGIVETAPGGGHCLLIAPDVTGSVVRIQQGVAITRDGVSAPDGTAPVADGVLKSDDGAVLDWDFDRRPVPGAPGLSAFLHPVADVWREILLRAIFHLARQARVALPLLWLYPRNLPAVAHLSHDTDGNDPALGRRLLEIVAEAGIASTWCVILPGYDAALLADIRAAGHELAAHFDAMSDGTVFTEEELDTQLKALSALFGEAPVTNKNHYLRWEGDTEFFGWLAARGIRLDQSKGASKTGEAGFNFGTCHPYFPVGPEGEPLDVLELPTPTQDLHVFAPPCIVPPLLDAVCRSHGVLHLLFHPAHMAKDGVADALLGAVREAESRGLEWWTASRLNTWERARRAARWSGYQVDDRGARATLNLPPELAGATILWLDHGSAGDVERWGFPFRAFAAPGTGEIQTQRAVNDPA